MSLKEQGSHDPRGNPATAVAKLQHKGPELRHGPRRVTSDRRDMVRWEPGKGGRRAAKDRRTTVTDLWDRNFTR